MNGSTMCIWKSHVTITRAHQGFACFCYSVADEDQCNLCQNIIIYKFSYTFIGILSFMGQLNSISVFPHFSLMRK